MHLLNIEDKPTPSVTVNSEGPISCMESQVIAEKTPDTGNSQDTNNTTVSSRNSTNKYVMSTPSKEINSKVKGNSLEQEWDQFNQKLQDTPKTTDT